MRMLNLRRALVPVDFGESSAAALLERERRAARAAAGAGAVECLRGGSDPVLFVREAAMPASQGGE